MASIVKVCLLGAVFLSQGAWASLEPLPEAKLRKLQKEHCVLVHLWADWCPPCVQELPKLLPLLEKWKGGRAVVIDVSSGFAQEHFSRKWDVLKRTSLLTYLKPPKSRDASYRKVVDPEWQGSLPYTVLYSRGKKLKAWRGVLDFDAVSREAATLCR